MYLCNLKVDMILIYEVERLRDEVNTCHLVCCSLYERMLMGNGVTFPPIRIIRAPVVRKHCASHPSLLRVSIQ